MSSKHDSLPDGSSRALEFLAEREGRLLVRVRAAPGSARERLCGVHGGALKIAVRAPAERGRANEAITSLLASMLGVSRSAVALESGHGTRDKVFSVCGISLAKASERIELALQGETNGKKRSRFK